MAKARIIFACAMLFSCTRSGTNGFDVITGYGAIKKVAIQSSLTVETNGKQTNPHIMHTKKTTSGTLLPKTSYINPIKIKIKKLDPTIIVPRFFAIF